MSTQQITPSVGATITYDQTDNSQHIVTTLPVEIIQMLQWITDNTFLPTSLNDSPDQPPQKKYLYPANVIYRDVIDVLVPLWQAQYTAGLMAEAKKQLADQEQAIADQAVQAVGNVVVVGG